MDFKENEVEDLERIYKDVNAEPIQISYAVVKSITKNFVQVIGRGGFGVVYLGALRNGLVAVKKLSPSKDLSDTQFLEEVKCLKKVNHKNIVRFLGYCADTQGMVMEVGGKSIIVEVQQRLLCFDYVPNGSLHNYLQEKTHGYEWNIRYQIIKGICQGLRYLHDLRINHLDLKPANVLLGAQMEPKITDFGVSRFIDANQSKLFTINLCGTPGYIAPEFIDEGQISFKSDIFGLGIIMKRLLTGSNDTIPENWHELLNVDCQQMKRCTEIAQICTDHDPSKRPTISEIIYQLNETETIIQKIPADIVVSEPRHDPSTKLYQVVQRFRTLPAQTPGEYHRWPEKLVEHPKWKLVFRKPPKLPIIIGEKIEDANGNPLEVVIVDAVTGEPSAVPNVLRIELVPLLGNFPRGSWDSDNFQRGVVKDPEGKRPLLVGEYRLTMWDGRAIVNKLMFTDDSLMCGCMLRIGVRVIPGSYNGARILEAMTEAFMVRDRQTYELHCKKGYKWQLAFQSQPRLPMYVGCRITDVIGNPLEVVLVDMETGSPSALPTDELGIQLVQLSDLLTLQGSNFQNCVIPRDRSYLSGDVSLTMKGEGHVTVSDLQFTDTMYAGHIGVCVASGGYNGPGILEGVSHAFGVEHRKAEMDEKRYPPALGDEVWRLQCISWGGEFHKRLEQNNIRSVQDFLRMLAVKPEELRAMMGDDGEEGDLTWQHITSHAKVCNFPGDKVYAYAAAVATIYVNSIFDLIKVEFGGLECPLQQLDDAQKRLVEQAMQEAHEHRHCLQEVKTTWKLAFKSPPRLPIHVGGRITDVVGNSLEVILVDKETGSPWASPMKLHIEMIPLLGDFPPYHYQDSDWSVEEFQAAIVKPRPNHVPLLTSGNDDGPRTIRENRCIMRDGCVAVNDLRFMDDSSWVRCRKFRIGARVITGFGSYDGSFRVLEAMTEAFEVDGQKHYPPVLDDHVWRLEMIDKDGEVHRQLASNSIDTVQEFRRILNVKPDELRAMMGGGMTDRMWAMTTNHAEDCATGDKVYAYSGAKYTIYVDSVFGGFFIEVDGVEFPLTGDTDRAQKMLVRQLILEAYEHRHKLQEVDAAMEFYDRHNTVWYLHVHGAQQDDDEQEVPVPQSADLAHRGPTQADTSSAS